MTDPIRLRQLLSHPSLSKAVLLSGRRALEGVVTAVRVVPGLEVGSLARGELAVTVALAPDQLAGWRLDAAIRRLRDLGCVGLLLPVRQLANQAAPLLAERLDVALLGTAEDDVLGWASTAAALLASPQVDRASRLEQAHRKLAGQLADPTTTARLLGAVLGTPIAVLDSDGDSLVPEQLPTIALPAGPVPALVDTAGGATYLVPVRDTTGRTAELWLAAPVPEATEQWLLTVRNVLEVGASAIQRWRAIRRLDAERDARIRASLLSDLLERRFGEAAYLRQRALDAGWRLDGWHVAVHLTALRRGRDQLSWTDPIAAAFRDEGLQATVVERGDGWSAWVTSERQPTASDTRRSIAMLRAIQDRLGPRLQVAVGIGRGRHGPDGLARSLAEAWDAARLARNQPASGRLVHIDRLGLAQLLLAWASTDTFAPTAAALLAPLRQHPGDLVQTLTTFLDCGAFVADTAAALGVHRNTVASRVRRIERLLGVDLAKPDDRLALHLACRVAGPGV